MELRQRNEALLQAHEQAAAGQVDRERAAERDQARDAELATQRALLGETQEELRQVRERLRREAERADAEAEAARCGRERIETLERELQALGARFEEQQGKLQASVRGGSPRSIACGSDPSERSK